MISTASPVSSISTMSGSDEKHVVPSPVEPGHYFPDDKIVLISHEQPPTAQFGQTARSGTLPPGYQHELAATPRKPFWKRHLILLVGLLVIFSLVAGIVIGILVPRISKRAAERQQISVANNVKASVAATGLFLKDKTTWNTQTFWQNTNGTISYQMSTDGSTFSSTRNVTLYQRPKVGSPISATAATDNTGVVYLTLFYVSEEKKIAMAALACAAGSSSCSTVANNLLTTTVPIADTTGLAAVNVDNAQDWRVYYQDQSNQLSQLQGNASGFDRGTVVGGLVLNGSSIAAVNCNATTNNINIFYVDMLTQVLYGQQFTKGDWTQGTPLSNERISNWNPTSGLGAAYTSTQDQLHVYYTGLDAGTYEFLGSKASTTNTTWAPQPGRNHVWGVADFAGASIGAVGWRDQARFFFRSGGRMVMGSLSNTTWTEKFVGLDS